MLNYVTWQWTPYALPLLAAGAASILLALRAVRSGQRLPLSEAGAWLLLAGTVWTTCYALELSSVSLARFPRFGWSTRCDMLVAKPG
jgi:hypothetical protein